MFKLFALLFLLIPLTTSNMDKCTEGSINYVPDTYEVRLYPEEYSHHLSIKYIGHVLFKINQNESEIRMIHLLKDLDHVIRSVKFGYYNTRTHDTSLEYYVDQRNRLALTICLNGKASREKNYVSIFYEGFLNSIHMIPFPCDWSYGVRANVRFSVEHPENVFTLASYKDGPDGPTRVPSETPNFVTTSFDEANMKIQMFNYHVSTLQRLRETIAEPVYEERFDLWTDMTSLPIKLGLLVNKNAREMFNLFVRDYTYSHQDSSGQRYFALVTGGAKTDGCHLMFLQTKIFESDWVRVLTIGEKVVNQILGCWLNPQNETHDWLITGFNNLFKYKIADSAYQEESFMDLMTIDSLQYALREDGYETDHAYRGLNLDTQRKMSGSQRAGSVLWMISQLMQPMSFQTAVQQFQAQDVTTLEFLQEELQRRVEQEARFPTINIADIFDSWMSTDGYPLINVTRDNKVSFTISQQRFSYNKVSSKKLWAIPIWLGDTISDLSVASATYNRSEYFTADWMLARIGQNGTYRVNYCPMLWKSITRTLRSSNFTHIPVAVRARLIDDSMNIARAGYIEYSVAYELLGYLTQETEYLPWAAAYENLKYVHSILYKTELDKAFQNFLLELVKPTYERLGLKDNDGDTNHIKELRSIAIDLASLAGDKEVHKKCEEQTRAVLFGEQKKTTYEEMVKELKPTVCCNALRFNDISEADLMTMYNYKPQLNLMGAVGRYYLKCLSCSSNSKIIKRLVSKALTSKNEIERQRIPKLLFEGQGYNEKSITAIIEKVDVDLQEHIRVGGCIRSVFEDFIRKKLPQFVSTGSDKVAKPGKFIVILCAALDTRMIDKNDAARIERIQEESLRLESRILNQTSYLTSKYDPKYHERKLRDWVQKTTTTEKPSTTTESAFIFKPNFGKGSEKRVKPTTERPTPRTPKPRGCFVGAARLTPNACSR